VNGANLTYAKNLFFFFFTLDWQPWISGTLRFYRTRSSGVIQRIVSSLRHPSKGTEGRRGIERKEEEEIGRNKPGKPPLFAMELTELTKHLDKINIPRTGDRIYKDECVYSFDTPVRLSLVLCPPCRRHLPLSVIVGHDRYRLNKYFLFVPRIQPPASTSASPLS